MASNDTYIPVNVGESMCKGFADIGEDQKENSQGKKWVNDRK